RTPRATHLPYTTLFRSEACAGNALVAERRQQVVLVVNEAAGGGDEIGMRLHQCEFAVADHAAAVPRQRAVDRDEIGAPHQIGERSEEHTSELQSRENLV